MSGFCVFGVTRAVCKKIAEQKVDPYLKDEGVVGGRRRMTQEEFLERVDALAKELFKTGVKPRQISPAFDAPHFAEEWIAVGLRTESINSPRIMVRGIKTDKKGAPVNNKKGLAIISWVPYVAQTKVAA